MAPGVSPRAASLRRGRSGIVGVVFAEHLGTAFLDPVKTLMMDSMDMLWKEYKKRISDKPAKNFPDKVDRDTKAIPGDVFRLDKVAFNTNSS